MRLRIRPDGFTGALMAVESIDDARAVLHGPGGCRTCHMILSRKLYPRMEKEGMSEYNLPFFYGQPRLPCTYLEENDYINGAYDIMKEALPIIGSKDDKMIVVIDSPGAALIGDNHQKAISECELDEKAFSIDESLISAPLSTGYDLTMRSVLEWLSPERTNVQERGVNILGMSILDKDWVNGVREIEGLIKMLDLDIISIPGAGCSTDDLKMSVNASLNIVIYPEFGLNLAEYYEKKYGIPYIISPYGAPIGFDATEHWIDCIAKTTSTDPKKALEHIGSYKKDVFNVFMGSRYKTVKLKGSSFSICGDASVVFPLTKWLYEYVSLTPVAVRTDPGSYQPYNDALKDFLDSKDLSESWNREPIESDLIFADGDTSMIMECSGLCNKGIDIGMPTTDHDNLIPRPMIGPKGAMYILDEIMRSV